MARVACTLRGKRLDGGVSVLLVGVNPISLKNPGDELTYARVKCYICHVIGDPQLGINRFESSLLLGYEDMVTALHVAFQWTIRVAKRMASIGQVLELG
jgi:hypothetical protein